MKKETLAAIAPYCVWMLLLFVLPSTAISYAMRTLITCIVGVAAFFLSRASWQPFCLNARAFLFGILGGVGVLVLWVLPEFYEPYRNFSLLAFLGLSSSATSTISAYSPEVCGMSLTLLKLFGSAFIIAPVEELFFRSFLYRVIQRGDWTRVDLKKWDFGAFFWVVALFALEHETRLLAGAMAGVIYGILAIRTGLFSAIVAHITTNLLLGLYVILFNQWHFW